MLAIVIPYFKRAFFEKTLSSLAAQTSKDFKVYIGNDASPEDPKELIDKYSSQLNICYKEFDNNLGGNSLVRQWDRCIDLTGSEDWLMLLGDDDYLDPHCVERFHENLEKIKNEKINVIRFASRIFWQDQSKDTRIYTHPERQKATEAFYEVYFGTSRSSLSEFVFSRDAYQKYGFRNIPLAWGSDNLAWLDFTKGGEIYTINDALVNIRMSSENISRNNFQESTKSVALHETFKLVIKDYLDKFKPGQRKDLLFRYEHYTMNVQKVSFGFWFKMSGLFLKEQGLIETIKFTRRSIYYSFKV